MCLSAFLLGIQDSGLRQFEGHVGVLKNQALEIGSVRVVPRTFPGDLFFLLLSLCGVYDCGMHVCCMHSCGMYCGMYGCGMYFCLALEGIVTVVHFPGLARISECDFSVVFSSGCGVLIRLSAGWHMCV